MWAHSLDERFRMLFDSAPVGMALSTYGGRIVALNRRLRRMLGFPAKQAALTKTADELYADPGARRKLIQKLRRNGRLQAQTVRVKRNDGSVLLLLLQTKEIEVERRRVLLTVAQDVTEQVQAEDRLAGVAALLKLYAGGDSLQQYLASVVKLLRDWCECRCVGIRLPDGKGHLPYAAQVGFRREFLTKENRLCISPTGCACMRALAAGDQPGQVEMIGQQRSYFCNSATRYAEALGAAPQKRQRVLCLAAGYESLAHAALRYHDQLVGTIHLADPSPGRFPQETVRFLESVGPVVAEAIHRFRVEESLQESEERFRSMFERHAAVMLLVDPESGAIVDANPAAAEFYGYSQEQLRRMGISAISTIPSAGVARRRRQLVSRAQDFFVFPHKLASGEIRTVEVHSSPIKVKGRSLLFSIIHDITERKLLEKELLDVGEKERERVGQDLHDSLGGKLTGIALMSKVLAQTLSEQSPATAAVAEEVVHSVNELIAQARSIAHGLCPAELRYLGLPGALSQLSRETERLSGVSCHFQADRKVRLRDRFLATHLFRIAQEAVNNAIRHGAARNIWITLKQIRRGMALEIRDDGLGLPVDPGATGGLGLRSMSYRAGVIGAGLSVRRPETGGTLVSCLLPHEQNRSVHSKAI